MVYCGSQIGLSLKVMCPIIMGQVIVLVIRVIHIYILFYCIYFELLIVFIDTVLVILSYVEIFGVIYRFYELFWAFDR